MEDSYQGESEVVMLYSLQVKLKGNKLRLKHTFNNDQTDGLQKELCGNKNFQP